MLKKLSAVIASEAKQSIGTASSVTMDCFVASLLAMTEETPTSVIPGRASNSGLPEFDDIKLSKSATADLEREPGISRNNVEIPDRSAVRTVRNDNKITEATP
jgi:hypothetical protein